ncbi:SipW-dependent-type signal peptide-containing protein [Salinirubrum litoreum]|uniref:SipW-dependent-type signal peptide-containing protein n=1 Tax=Salinirubrum litoreum TaxID=1126234 RepID=A0ABD5R8P6_9EURY|nr:SipW-dependent-type signal peptide-containing protein [Salinirubrum litoreum]
MANNSGFDISRREVLAGLGTIGIASAGAGLGTTAYFSDREDFQDNTLTAGELDLKVDWQEHYSDWSDDEAEGIDTVAMEPGDGLTGFPSAADPTNQSVFVSDPDQFLRNTVIEAFPDADPSLDAANVTADDYDAVKTDPANDSDICNLPADTDGGNGVLSHPFRTGAVATDDGDGYTAGGDPNPQTTAAGDPLIQIADVKPGDFGEVTFSFHVCGNPGYVWLTGDLVSASENGLTEPEQNDPDEDGDPDSTTPADVELLSEIQVAFWYDTGENGYGADFGDKDEDEGDNYLQPGESPIQMGTLGGVLLQLQNNPFPLDANPVTATTSTATSGSSNDTAPVLDDLADADGDTDGDGDSYRLYVSTEDEPFKSFVTGGASGNPAPKNLNCGDYDNLLFDGMSLVGTAIEAEMLEAGMDYSSCAGLTVDSLSDQRGDSDLDTITLSTDNPVRVVSVKGGNEGENIYVFDQPVILNGVTFTTPTGQGISNIDVCCPVDGDDGNGGGGPVGDPDRDCFPNSTTAYIGFEWWLPVDHANEIQTDSVSFDLGFYTEQCRHNDGGTPQAPENG